MAIGPSDTLLGQKRRDVPATFETNPVLSGPPGQGPAAPITPKPTTRGPGRSGPAAPSPSPAPAAPSPGQALEGSLRLAQGLTRPESLVANAGQPITGESAFSKGGSFGLLAPGLSARERGQELREGAAGIARDIGSQAAGAWNKFAAASDAVLRPVGEFVQGAAGVQPPQPGVRGAANSTTGAVLRGVVPALAQGTRIVLSEAGVNPGALVRNTLQSLSGGSGPAPNPAAAAQSQAQPQAQTPASAAQEAQPAAPQTPAPPALAAPAGGQRMGTFVGSDGVVRQIPDGDLQAPGRAAPAAPAAPAAAAGALQAPALPQMQMRSAPTNIPRADPSRTQAGDEATKRAMQAIESQLFRNSFGANRGERSARALQGQLIQSLAGLAPTLGASADAADARNVQARTALAQTQAQQNAAQLQAQAGLSANERRAQAAELVAQIGAGARPPTLITGEQGAYTLGPNGQAVPVLGPDGTQVRPTGGGGQGIRADTLFKEFNGRIAAIQSDPTLSPEAKQQQIAQLYADPLFQGLAQYLQQPGQ